MALQGTARTPMLQHIFKLLWTVKFDCILDFGWKFTAMSYMLGFTI